MNTQQQRLEIEKAFYEAIASGRGREEQMTLENKIRARNQFLFGIMLFLIVLMFFLTILFAGDHQGNVVSLILDTSYVASPMVFLFGLMIFFARRAWVRMEVEGEQIMLHYAWRSRLYHIRDIHRVLYARWYAPDRVAGDFLYLFNAKNRQLFMVACGTGEGYDFGAYLLRHGIDIELGEFSRDVSPKHFKIFGVLRSEGIEAYAKEIVARFKSEEVAYAEQFPERAGLKKERIEIVPVTGQNTLMNGIRNLFLPRITLEDGVCTYRQYMVTQTVRIDDIRYLELKAGNRLTYSALNKAKETIFKLTQDMENADLFIEKLIKCGTTVIGADKQSQRYLEQVLWPEWRKEMEADTR